MPSSNLLKSVTVYVFLKLLLLLFVTDHHAESGSIVKTLPGFSGVLPFKLETGYVSVGESELFYLFVESQGKPRQDPLLLYLIGGPGCSALNGFFFQVGPLIFNTTDYTGGLPELLYNPFSWTKTASIIFVDAPVGTGFSYSTSPQGYLVSDTLSAIQTHIFLRKWLSDHPDFTKTQFFIASDSYAGLLTPIIAQEILQGNDAGLHPPVNLKGFLSGSPHTNSQLEANCLVPIAYRLALISRTLYESAKNSCNGNYVDVDVSNAECVEALEMIQECIDPINDQNILDPKCATLSPKPNEERIGTSLKAILKPNIRDYWCQNFYYILADVWANDERVQDALHVRKGTIKEWYRCNLSLTNEAYTYDITNSVGYYQNLSTRGLQILLYSGDHDMVVPYISTEAWISSLNITIDDAWRPWFVDGQVAGYTVKYSDYGFRLTFATLKGAGHSPTQYKPRECYNMFLRWIHYYPL